MGYCLLGKQILSLGKDWGRFPLFFLQLLNPRLSRHVLDTAASKATSLFHSSLLFFLFHYLSVLQPTLLLIRCSFIIPTSCYYCVTPHTHIPLPSPWPSQVWVPSVLPATASLLGVTSIPKLTFEGGTKVSLATRGENEVPPGAVDVLRTLGDVSQGFLPQLGIAPVHGPLLQHGPFQANNPHKHRQDLLSTGFTSHGGLILKRCEH